jgi:hypothetical protein
MNEYAAAGSSTHPDHDPELDHTAELRERAVRHLKKRRDFRGHLLIYVLVNTFLVVIWAVTTPGGFFWPIFPLVGWGIGVAANAWDVFVSEDITEDAIRREMEHLERHGA